MEVKTYTQTLEFLRSYIEPVASTAEKAISEALGFVLAEDLHSPIDLPLFNNSAMDGWAFGSEDIKPEGFTLKEVGSSFAGHPYIDQCSYKASSQQPAAERENQQIQKHGIKRYFVIEPGSHWQNP